SGLSRLGHEQDQAWPPRPAGGRHGADRLPGLRCFGADDRDFIAGGWRMDGGVTRKPSVTSSMVADHAGVSQSAVSRTFTPGASISSKTRAKVLAAAKELGYRPNAIARSLITNRSRIIAVVMSYLENLFYPDVLEELGRRLAAENYHVLLFTGFMDRDSDPVFDQLMQYRVDGIVLASTSLSSELSEECAAAGIPVVLFNRTTERDVVSSVTSRNREGGR